MEIIRFGCPVSRKTARSVMPGTVAIRFWIRAAVLASTSMSSPKSLSERVLAFHPRHGLLDVVLDVLRKIERHSGIAPEGLIHFLDEVVLAAGGLPGRRRF